MIAHSGEISDQGAEASCALVALAEAWLPGKCNKAKVPKGGALSERSGCEGCVFYGGWMVMQGGWIGFSDSQKYNQLRKINKEAATHTTCTVHQWIITRCALLDRSIGTSVHRLTVGATGRVHFTRKHRQRVQLKQNLTRNLYILPGATSARDLNGEKSPLDILSGLTFILVHFA